MEMEHIRGLMVQRTLENIETVYSLVRAYSQMQEAKEKKVRPTDESKQHGKRIEKLQKDWKSARLSFAGQQKSALIFQMLYYINLLS